MAAICLGLMLGKSHAQDHELDDLLNRASKQASLFLEQFSDVKCTEQVKQEKLNQDGKVERDAQSTYDYLVILSNTGGEMQLNESRLVIREAKADKKGTSFLLTNGFATLFLVFHPYYSGNFQFTAQGDEVIDGQRFRKIEFHHVAGTRSLAALALRGRDYPLEISGTAWIDSATGNIAKIQATIGTTMEDVGLKTLNSEVIYAPIPFRDLREVYWFPARATVEVETPRQHWRNTHSFTDYKLFSVSTEEKVAAAK
jgi:hypothetical protein